MKDIQKVYLKPGRKAHICKLINWETELRFPSHLCHFLNRLQKNLPKNKNITCLKINISF